MMERFFLSSGLVVVLVCFILAMACALPGRETPLVAIPPPKDTQEVTQPPVVIPDEPAPATIQPAPTTPITDTALLKPEQIVYLGAFRLPGEDEKPKTFAYGGTAMTFNPAGDPGGAADGFPGSLFIMGHDRQPYGDLPDGSQVAEVSIPSPTGSTTLEELSQAGTLQDFSDVNHGFFTGLEEIPRAGLLYLDNLATGPIIHITFGQHLQPDPPAASHAWFSPNLNQPAFHGTWFLDQNPYGTTGYMLIIPADWASVYAQGRVVGTGRFRDGGWSGMGPTLFAYLPWDANGNPHADGATLPTTVLLQYQNSETSADIDHSLTGYQHPDEWEGAAWLTTPGGQSAVLIAGTKSTGEKYWYGFVNPKGPQYPCVEEEMNENFTTCRLASGSPCPQEDFIECSGHNDFRGWWSTHWAAQFLLYNPSDLARVAEGQMQPWEPQPYAVIDLEEHMLNNPSGVEIDMVGSGVQRRFKIGEAAYDRANGLLYVLELYADGAKPVVHVWQIE
jgi:hypothetical protein